MSLKIKLIVTDLDNTLLYQKNEISRENYCAIQRAKEQGCLFAVATGRCGGIIPMENLPEIDYLITCNGSVVVDVKRKKRIMENAIPVENARKALELIRSYHTFMEIFADDNIVLERETALHLENYTVPAFHLSYFEQKKEQIVSSYEEYLSGECGKIGKINLPCKEYGKLATLRGELERLGLFCVSSDGSGIELTNRDVDKGHALLALCAYLKILPRETVAFGDGANDVNMLRIAGYGVAMANAVMAAKEAAPYSTAHHRQDGVALFLRREFGI